MSVGKSQFVLRVDDRVMGKWPVDAPVPDWAKRYGPWPEQDKRICKERGSSSWFCCGKVCVTIE